MIQGHILLDLVAVGSEIRFSDSVHIGEKEKGTTIKRLNICLVYLIVIQDINPQTVYFM